MGLGSLSNSIRSKLSGATALAALKHRNFRLFYFGQIISLIGFWMQNVALAWVVLELTNSPFLLGMVTFVQFIPNLIFSLAAGVLTDRIPRRVIVLSTQVAFMVLAVVLTLLSYTEILSYGHIIVLSAFMGIFHAIDIPARQAFLVEMVGRNDLTNAIALNSSMFNAARVIGPAIGGIILARFGATTCFFINALSFSFVIIGLLAMRLEKKSTTIERKNMLSQIKDGLQYILNTPGVLIPMSLLASLSITTLNFGVLTPVFARDVLNQGPEGYGLLVSALGFGSLAGAIGLIFYSARQHQIRFLWSGAVGLAVFELLLGQIRWYWLTAVLLIGAGWSMVTMAASVNSIIQSQVPDDLRGRVMSVYSLSFIGLSALGGLLAGAVAKWFDSPTAFTLGGALALVATVILVRKWRLEKCLQEN